MANSMRSLLAFLACISRASSFMATGLHKSHAFGVSHRPLVDAPLMTSTTKPRCRPVLHRLDMAQISITSPSPDEAADMGIRDWPQQSKQGSWVDSQDNDDGTLVRYILDGSGSVTIEDADDGSTKTAKVSTGTLIEVIGKATIFWESPNEMIVLTPGFEEGGKLIGVAIAMLVLFGALLAGVGS